VDSAGVFGNEADVTIGGYDDDVKGQGSASKAQADGDAPRGSDEADFGRCFAENSAQAWSYESCQFGQGKGDAELREGATFVA